MQQIETTVAKEGVHTQCSRSSAVQHYANNGIYFSAALHCYALCVDEGQPPRRRCRAAKNVSPRTLRMLRMTTELATPRAHSARTRTFTIICFWCCSTLRMRTPQLTTVVSMMSRYVTSSDVTSNVKVCRPRKPQLFVRLLAHCSQSLTSSRVLWGW